MAFTTQASAAKQSRYTYTSATKPTAEGGIVGVGEDRNSREFLVHTIGRQVESIALPAVATAVVAGAIALPELVGAFKASGKLEALYRECEKQLPAQSPARKPKAAKQDGQAPA